MSILHRLRSDLQRSVAEHQAILLAQVLRQRFTELTLGDLREILTSPLGRGLDNLKLAELSQTAALGEGGKRGAPVVKRGGGRVTRPDASPVRSGRSPSATSTDYVSSIVEVLQSAGTGLTSGELRAKLGGSPSTMYRAVTELIKAGKVRSEGKPARYSWIPGAQYEVEGDDDDGDVASLPPPSKRGRPPVVSARTLEGRAHYDAQVMSLLQQTNGWIGASQLRAHVGGSDNQVRIALHRLVASGQVTRRGERNSTEYRLNARG
jgi:predicted transcriptional regulator